MNSDVAELNRLINDLSSLIIKDNPDLYMQEIIMLTTTLLELDHISSSIDDSIFLIILSMYDIKDPTLQFALKQCKLNYINRWMYNRSTANNSTKMLPPSLANLFDE